MRPETSVPDAVDAVEREAAPLRLVVLHRGEPPNRAADPWASVDEPRVLQLARAIASSDGWRGRAPASLSVRTGGEPLIAAVGRFGDADLAWLGGASHQLATTLERVVLLDHAAAETAAERLAAALVERFGLEAVRSFRFAGVPRGGLLVLGLLAYVLDLPHDRLTTTTSPEPVAPDDAPLVLVDDVAISGVRLSRVVRSRRERRLLVATLHAHPDLRAAFVARHPAVELFLTAHDLVDHAPAALGDGYVAWRARWSERADPDAAWIGQPDQVVYPWNEPDLSVWNEVTAREESGWSVVPPERCLKRRGRPSLKVQHMEACFGRLRMRPDVIAVEAEDAVVLGRGDTAASFVLEGVAADMWRALAATGTRAAAGRQLSSVYDVDEASLVDDLDAFVADLHEAGLLAAEPA